MTTELIKLILMALTPWCSMSTPWVRVSEEGAVLLVVATGEQVTVPVVVSPWLLKPPDSITEVTAYRFRILDAAGDAEGLSNASSFLAVPWSYDGGCKAETWQGEWVPPGTEGVFLFYDVSSAMATEVVVNVLGWHAPYPSGEFLKYTNRLRPPEDRSEWLSAREYFELVAALPPLRSSEDWQQNAAVLARVFREGNPRWSTTFPGTEILGSVPEVRKR